MNKLFLASLAAGIFGAAAPLATAGLDEVPVRTVVSIAEEQVILDVFTNITEPLRGFGFSVGFDPDSLTLLSGGRYEGIWFLRGENGISYPHTDLTSPKPGLVRVVGGRFDGSNPQAGVAGEHLLLATLVFRRNSARPPEFELGFASPEPYANFVLAEGEVIDKLVVFDKPEVQVAPEDSDEDGLPDDYEREVYGDLKTSDGDTDTDGDGESDRDEWLRGTDGTDPHSKFEFEVIPQPDGSKMVIWNGQPDRVYDLEWTNGLAEFAVIAAGLPGAELLESLDGLHNKDRKGFYRIITKFPSMGR